MGGGVQEGRFDGGAGGGGVHAPKAKLRLITSSPAARESRGGIPAEAVAHFADKGRHLHSPSLSGARSAKQALGRCSACDSARSRRVMA